MDSRYPKRKPWLRPRVAPTTQSLSISLIFQRLVRKVISPGFKAPKMLLYNFACAASDINKITKSELPTTSYISPKVPFSSLNPTALASLNDGDPALSPIVTVIPVPSNVSARFWAWAGAWKPQPITPIF